MTRDPLIVAGLFSILIVGVVAVADILATHGLESGVLALLVAVIGPITPVIIARSRNGYDRNRGTYTGPERRRRPRK